jgi:hypothetical protein
MIAFCPGVDQKTKLFKRMGLHSSWSAGQSPYKKFLQMNGAWMVGELRDAACGATHIQSMPSGLVWTDADREISSLTSDGTIKGMACRSQPVR